MKPRLIALDGAVAVGKSTVGRLLAKRLGYRFIDTGLMYRAVTLKAIRSGAIENKEELIRIAKSISFSLTKEGLLIDGEEASEELRSHEVERLVSPISTIPEVREVLVEKQRELARKGGVVMAGRDIGTVVLPQAELKVFLTASTKERARRRFEELGGRTDYSVILDELIRRDEIDSKRDISPLKPAPDAIILNTENLSPEEVVNKILSLID